MKKVTVTELNYLHELINSIDDGIVSNLQDNPDGAQFYCEVDGKPAYLAISGKFNYKSMPKVTYADLTTLAEAFSELGFDYAVTFPESTHTVVPQYYANVDFASGEVCLEVYRNPTESGQIVALFIVIVTILTAILLGFYHILSLTY